MSEHGHSHPPPAGRDYEDRDIQLRPILTASLFILLLMGFTFWGVRLLIVKLSQHNAAKDVPASVFIQERVLPPEPRLQVDEKRDLVQQRAVEQAALEEYGWVDQSAGVVRLPIERAMDVVAERGLPARAAAK